MIGCVKMDELGSHEFGAEAFDAATAKRPSLVFAVVRHAVDLTSDYDTDVIRLFHEAAFITIVG